MTIENSGSAATRVPTGVPGLDDILCGGFLRPGFYLLQGDPGAGKTTLALQYLFSCQERGEPGLYITLTESEEDLLRTCQAHGWDLSRISVVDLTKSNAALNPAQDNTVFYPSEIELVEITQQIISEVTRLKPRHVVFDGLSELRLLSVAPLRYRHQLLSLKEFFVQNGINILLLDDRSAPSRDVPAESLVGANIVMERYLPGYGATRRRMQVTKVRGAAFRDGYHNYEVTQGGIVVYPRLHVSKPTEPSQIIAPALREQFGSGIPNLDAMLNGGLETGTTTLLLGPSGVGKSTVAMKYVAAALERGERAAAFILDETLATFVERSEKLCAGSIRDYIRDGRLRVQQVNPAELSPGSFATDVANAVEAGARIVVIDSLNGYMNAMPEEAFLAAHLHELFTYLNQCDIVTLIVATQHGLVHMDRQQFDVSYLADTVLLFRNFEARGQILKAFSVFKKRSGGHEQALRQLIISADGIAIGEPLAAFHGIMTGVPEYHGETALTLRASGAAKDGVA